MTMTETSCSKKTFQQNSSLVGWAKLYHNATSQKTLGNLV